MSLAFFKQILQRRATLAAAAVFSLFSMMSASAADVRVLERPMEFLLVHGDSEYCRSDGSCAEWISAEGVISADSPAKLQRLLKRLGNRKLPIVVRSPGGDVAAAEAMGQIVRKLGLSVAVGGTRVTDCPPDEPLCKAFRQKDGSVVGEAYSVGSICASACPLFLAGGARRVAGTFAAIAVQPMTTTYRTMRIKYRTEYKVLENHTLKVLSKREIGRKEIDKRDTTKVTGRQKADLIAYLGKMGIDPTLFDLMMSVTPKSVRVLSQVEALKLGVITESSNAAELVLAGPCPTGKTLASCLPAVVAPPPTVSPQSPPLPDTREPGKPQPTEQEGATPAASPPAKFMRTA